MRPEGPDSNLLLLQPKRRVLIGSKIWKASQKHVIDRTDGESNYQEDFLFVQGECIDCS